MNIQIFGKNKCFVSKAAERFFRERKIKCQFVNILDKGLSERELDNVLSNIKDINLLFDKNSSLYESLNIAYITRSVADKKELLLQYPALYLTPIVRECETKKCTIGQADDIWKNWLNTTK